MKTGCIDQDRLRSQVKHLVADLFRPDVFEPDTIRDEEPPGDGESCIDAEDAVELALCVEEEFGVAVHCGEESNRVFTSIASMADFIHLQRAPVRRSAGARIPVVLPAPIVRIGPGGLAQIVRCAASLTLGLCAALGLPAASQPGWAEPVAERQSYTLRQDAPVEWVDRETVRPTLASGTGIFTRPANVLAPTVVELATRRLAAESLFSRRALDQELVRRELSDFDRFVLNRYPLVAHVGFVRFGLGSTNAERARERYQAEEKLARTDEMIRFAAALAAVDPAAARALRHFVWESAGPARTVDELKYE